MSKVTPGTSDPAYPAYPAPPNPVFAEPLAPANQPRPYGAPGHSTTVVAVQPGALGGAQPGGICQYQEAPCLIVCQFCTATVTTSTSYSVGTLTWLAAGFLFIMGCSVGCCLIPFCIDGCKDVIHTCPNCQQVVGRYSRA